MKSTRTTLLAGALALALLLAACAPKRKVYVAPKPPAIKPPVTPVQPPPPPPVAWTAANAMRPAVSPPELRDDEPAQTLIDAIDLSLKKFAEMDPAATVSFGA